ncbi:MAG: agmatine deiminase family protein [Lewinellaceae bacterium]|nr:agmatine deiminase family protein [Phaeodactylibacter sp.]MCB9348653.1 agmatine deiminase family protein [Lewinellaceae bacterium]
MKCFLHTLFFLCALLAAKAQSQLPASSLPQGTEAQDRFAGEEGPAARFSGVPIPPPAPVRTMAEWEEVQAIVITWDFDYSNILKEIVRYSQSECRVIIITHAPEQVEAYLQFEEIPLSQVTFINANWDSVWIRDYGPWSVYHNDVDSLMIVDWIYDDLSRLFDDQLSGKVAALLGLPLYEATEAPYDWIHAGGNNLQDGMGSLFSSELVLQTNPGKTMEEIAAIAQAYLGITPGRYFTMPVLPYDSIHHLDMHMRFLDEETLLVGQYPEGVADGPQIEGNVAFLHQLTTAFGNPYRIIRIPMPPDVLGRYPDEGGFYRTYTNGIFVNKTYLLPIYEERYDTTALRIYQEQLPGYTIVGIDCDQIVDNFGAIHCVTKLVGVTDPLRIVHPRLRDTENSQTPYRVEAIIQHRSGIANATLYYRTDPEGIYTPVPMALEDEQAARWAAAIPAQPAHTEVQYYIHATAHSGKQQVRPMVAPEGYFRFRVLGPAGSKGPAGPVAGLQVSVYPNPAGEQACLRFTSPQAQQVLIELANQQGQVVWSAAGELPAGAREFVIPVGHLAAGAYHLSVAHSEGRMGRVLVVER